MIMLTDETCQALVKELVSQGQEISGPDCEGLVALVKDSVERFIRSTDPCRASLSDFVGKGNEAEYLAAEAEVYESLRPLMKAAASALALMSPVPGAPDYRARLERQPWLRDLDHFEAALMSSANLPMAGYWDGRLKTIVDAIGTLGSLPSPEPKKRGVRPRDNSARIAVRASYYYRHLHKMSDEVNWDYPDRGGKPGTRTGPGELIPSTPAAKLACAVVELFELNADAAEIKHHLQTYRDQLKAERRAPEKSDFFIEWI